MNRDPDRRSLLSPVCAAAACLVLLCAATRPAACQQDVAQPEFVAEGDLSALRCKVVEIGGEERLGWLCVEVHNGGDLAAEPLTFAIECKGKPPVQEQFRRTRLPHAQRFGRSVAPSGKQRYWVGTSRPSKRRGDYSVSVQSACFHRGADVTRPELLAGAPDQVQKTSLAGTFPITRVPLKNPFDCDLDALFLVELSQPRDVVHLYLARVPAGGALDWDLYGVPDRTAWLDPLGGPGFAVKATGAELVDWSLVGEPDEEAARQRFASCYEGWIRWRRPVAMQGRFRHVQRRTKMNTEEYEDSVSEGSFVVRPNGDVTVDFDGGGRSAADRALHSAFSDLLRRPVDEVLAQNRCYLVDQDRVELRGPGFGAGSSGGARIQSGNAAPGSGDAAWYECRDGRIRGRGYGDSAGLSWTTQAFGSGYVVTVRQIGSSQFERFGYAELDGRVVPVRWSAATHFGERLFSSDELVLSALRPADDAQVAAAEAPAPPTGDGVDALREAWQHGARVPSEPLRITAQLDVRTPGTDGVWNGHQRVRGEVRMVGVGRACRELVFESSDDLAAEVERTLASVVYDRFLMWFGQDFNDREDFDALFAGATVGAPRRGVFEVRGCRVAEVQVDDGRVTRLLFANGAERTFRWGKVGSRPVVTQVRSGDATVEMQFADVDGHLLPTKIEFERQFGRDWGPEVITLRRLQVEQ